MLKNYKEVWIGVALGGGIWALDAVMNMGIFGGYCCSHCAENAVLGTMPQCLLRCLVVITTTTTGFVLWLSNRRRQQMQSLQATLDTFHQEVASPLLLIYGYTRMLPAKEGFPVTRETVELIRQIQHQADRMNQLIEKLPPPGSSLTPDSKAASISTSPTRTSDESLAPHAN
ncbi:MAG TPA: hypothetical protein PLB18_22420 [Acidobacteriota bacterium]|nr:hypothetical protein [Acidobacteriota bacterium]HNC45800.1 hypothetical protein [Acidobacteriota bacterium]HND22141.1 hypothetical protein [Acidobacteriota bacterium]HNG96320.1 hypothetical protein [Acidobacteriota bacterium]HNH83957.1 hypothetical protein [Acidobacteriota bacterium]